MRSDKERAYDSYLAASARIGDRQALSSLADRWHPRLMAHAYRLTGEADLAADAVQEAWIEILRGIGGLDDAAAFPAWAFRIVSRRCARIIRGRQRLRRTRTALAQEPAPDSVTPDRNLTRSDLSVVRTALEDLPRDQRATISLFYLEGMSVAEVAVALDVPPGTVKTRLMHARNKLRAQLGGNDDD